MSPYASLVDRAAVPVAMVRHGEKRAHNQSQAVSYANTGWSLTLLICTEIWAKNSICLHPKLTRLQRSNSLAVLLGAVPDRVNSNMQKHGQYWMQINRLLFNAAMQGRRSLLWEPYYLGLRERGFSTTAAFVALGRKLARVCFALLKNETDFNHNIHLGACAST